ncbi:hypothetical protein OCU04_008580 [Sclerotinia nivalis]|uniref:Fungal N-terminal domain-containing protein n=1 Tax=Sclerotinia nivalis TaxID=352851 RepID=A0A9X0AID4_9HELO|nr:hypothetical protein OCU04_008580 [Sclerotinia nivalis]
MCFRAELSTPLQIYIYLESLLLCKENTIYLPFIAFRRIFQLTSYFGMDPVGFTASVISIATLAVQLGVALRKAAAFWEAIQDAPSDIRRLSRELMLVANVFHAIRVEYEAGSVPKNCQNMIKAALDLAKDDVDQLSKFTSELTRKLSHTNGNFGTQWRKVQVALRASKIEKFKDNLKSVEIIMTLLQASRNQSSMIQVNSKLDILDTKISSIAATTTSSSLQITHQSSLQLMQNRPVSPRHRSNYTNGVFKSIDQHRTNFFFGTFSFRTISTTYRYDDNDSPNDADNSTTTKDYLVEFLIGFTTCRKGFRVTATNTFDHYRLDVIRRRPNNSEIFKVCTEGDAGAVKRLLDRGEASIYDVDEYGESLLHKAASCADPKLCQMLLDLGADVYLENNNGSSPMVHTIGWERPESFILICESGYDLWPSDELLAFKARHICNTISVWRYIYQVNSKGGAPSSGWGGMYHPIIKQMILIEQIVRLYEWSKCADSTFTPTMMGGSIDCSDLLVFVEGFTTELMILIGSRLMG